jgi:hypothetical protein
VALASRDADGIWILDETPLTTRAGDGVATALRGYAISLVAQHIAHRYPSAWLRHITTFRWSAAMVHFSYYG